MISIETCCFDSWENFSNSNLCVSQNNSGFSSIKNSKKSPNHSDLGYLTKKSVSIY